MKHNEIEETGPFIAKGRRLGKFFGAFEFGVEFGHEPGDVHLEQGGAIADEAFDVNRSGKDVEVAFFEGTNVVRADLGDLA